MGKETRIGCGTGELIENVSLITNLDLRRGNFARRLVSLPCGHKKMKLARLPGGSPEVFLSIQGEGRNTGMPAIFVRASLCNLYCQWCDTDYTWNWNDTEFPNGGSGKTYERGNEIAECEVSKIAEICGSLGSCRNYIFTGGEPLLQEKEWIRLMDLLADAASPGRDCHFELETNGVIFPGAEFVEKVTQINVSPKLSNSGVARRQRLKPDSLVKFAKQPKADFKFVISGTDQDLEEVLELVAEFGISKERTYLMPSAAGVAELNEKQTAVAEAALRHGFRYSDRLHLRLFGAGRGV